MKKIFYICIAAFAVAATSCSTKPDIDIDTHGDEGLEFVHFASASDAWLVTADDESYDYSVVVASTKAPAEAVTYNIALGEATTGVEGTDFSIPTKSVTIKAGEYSSELPVKILYDTTGEGFQIELVLSVEESLINPSYGASALITVKSDKVTIDWDWLAGNWNSQDYSYYSGKNDGDPYTVAISKQDDANGVITGLWGAGPLNFSVDFNAKTITLAGNQYGAEATQYSAQLFFVAVDPAADFDVFYDTDGNPDLTVPVVATLSPAGIVIDNYDFLLVGGAYDGYTYAGGIKSTLTR